MALPNEIFARVIETTALDQQVHCQQRKDEGRLWEWQKRYQGIQKEKGEWRRGRALVVTRPEGIEKNLVEQYHNSNTSGHAGIEQTYQQIAKDYWWPSLRQFVWSYIQGCGICQQNKTIIQRNNLPIYPITPPETTEPFEVIGVDLIVKLPKSKGYDSILTIMDQGSTKGVILLPCKETMGTKEIATLYKECVFPYIGLPDKTDRDVQFTGGLFKELCRKLGVKQNISLAYHPQTDSASKHMNQTVETALQIFGNYHQNDWVDWLPIVQYQINAHVSQTTKYTLFDLWIGYTP